MALISIDQLQAELPGYTVAGATTTAPTEDDALRFIDEIEAEVHALWVGAGGVWPADTDPAAIFPALTITLGASWRWLAAKYVKASAGGTPDSVTQARLAYNDRLGRIPKVVTGAEASEVIASEGPLVGLASERPGLSFGEWTVRQDPLSRVPTIWRPSSW